MTRVLAALLLVSVSFGGCAGGERFNTACKWPKELKEVSIERAVALAFIVRVGDVIVIESHDTVR